MLIIFVQIGGIEKPSTQNWKQRQDDKEKYSGYKQTSMLEYRTEI